MHCSPTSVVKWGGLVEPPLGLVPVMSFMTTCVSVVQPMPPLPPASTLLPQSGATYCINSHKTQVHVTTQNHMYTAIHTYLCHFDSLAASHAYVCTKYAIDFTSMSEQLSCFPQ